MLPGNVVYNVVKATTLSGSLFANTLDVSSNLTTNNNAITINTFTQTAGTVTMGSSQMTVNQNFSRTGGTFTANTSTVRFGSGNQSIGGSTSFYNLKKEILAGESSQTLSFANGSTTTVSNSAIFSGQPNALLLLRSSTPGSTWNITKNGTITAKYLDIEDSIVSVSTGADYSVLTGSNNVNWILGSIGSPFGSFSLKGNTSIKGSVSFASKDSSPIYSTPNITNGLVGWWKFDEANGTTAIDSSGSGNNGSITGSTTWGTAKVNNGLTFSATNGKFATGTNSILNTDIHTISFWFRMNANSGGWQQVLAYRPAGTDRSPGIWTHNSSNCLHWRYDPSNTGTECAGPNGENSYFTIGEWYHIVGIKNGSTFSFYVDGKKKTQINIANPKSSGPASVEMGQTAYGAAIMSLDDVRIYNRALSDSEVENLYGFTGTKDLIQIEETNGKTEVTEGGATDTYQISIKQAPTSDVTITLTPDVANQIHFLPSNNITFTPTDWDTPRTITVKAIDDSVFEIDPTYTVSYSVTSTDEEYNGTDTTYTTSITPTNITVIDNDFNFTNGLNAHYKFENNFNSETGSNNATAVNGTTFVNGVDGKSASFDGSNDLVNINATVLDTTTNGLTLSGWVKTSASGYIFSDHYTGSTWNSISLATDRFIINSSNAEGTQQTLLYQFPTDNNWHHLAATWDKTRKEMKIYIDGVYNTSKGNVANAPWNSTQIARLGGVLKTDQTVISPLNGQIDDFRIYNRALAEREIDELVQRESFTLVESLGTTIVEEGGHGDTIDISLKRVPFSTVTVTLSSQSLNTNITTLTFTPENWNVPQTVTVHAIDNNIMQKEGILSITSTSSDSRFNGITKTKYVNITDNETYTNGLLGAWNLDEIGGMTAADASGNGNDLLQETGFSDSFSTQSWTGLTHMTASVSNGVFKGVITNTADPYMWKHVPAFSPLNNTMHLRYKSYPNGPSRLRIYYLDSSECPYYQSEDCTQSFSIIPDGEWHDLDVAITDTNWINNNGNITNLRIDFEGFPGTGATTGEVYLEDIYFYKTLPSVETKIGQGMDFGTGNFLSTEKSSPFTSKEMTVSFWHKGSSVALGDLSLGQGFNVFTNGNIVTAQLFESGSNKIQNTTGFGIPSSEVHDGMWHHITFTADETGGRLYLDGVLKDSENWIGNPEGTYLSSGTFQIGTQGSTSTIGSIDNVRVYGQSLSASEVAILYTRENSAIKTIENNKEKWGYRKKITIQGSQVPENVSNFPVYLNLSSLGSDFFNSVKKDGGDIRVTTADGNTEIPREIVSIDTIAQKGEMHFLAPDLSASSNTDFYVYYGNASANDYPALSRYGEKSVWKDYLFVSHDGGGTDSTQRNIPTKEGNIIVGGIEGKVGKATQFDGIDDFIRVGANLTTPTYSISTWVKTDSSPINQQRIIASRGIGSKKSSSLPIWRAINYWLLARTDGRINLQYYNTLSHDGASGTGNSFPNFDTRTGFGLMGMSFTGSTLTSYQNGSVYETKTKLSPANTEGAQYLHIGSDPSSSWYITPSILYKGILDEIRITPLVRSANWFKIEHNNQNNPSAFYAIENEEILSRTDLVFAENSKVIVKEAGTGDHYPLTLPFEPTDTVNITITSSEGISIDRTFLEFSNENWDNPQILRVSAIDNNSQEKTGSITFQFSSADPEYDGISIIRNVEIIDNDYLQNELIGSLSVSETNGSTLVTEGGSGDNYSLSLPFQPSSNVYVAVLPDKDLSANIASLTFTPANWNIPQTVGVNAVENEYWKESGTILFFPTSSDARFNAQSTERIVSIADNEDALLKNLIGYWKFDEGTKTSTQDFSQNGNNGNLSNGVLWETIGKLGKSLNFDGVNDYLNIYKMSSFSSVSFSAWVKADQLRTQGIIQITDITGKNVRLFMTGGTGTIELDTVSGEIGNASKGGVTAGNWHHIAGVYDSVQKTAVVYVDGVAGTVVNSVNGFGTGGVNGTIGSLGSQYYFDGQIDDVRIYNKALTGAEIQNLRNFGSQ